MPIHSQTGRLISLTTPLGDDKLLLTGFTGREAIVTPTPFYDPEGHRARA